MLKDKDPVVPDTANADCTTELTASKSLQNNVTESNDDVKENHENNKGSAGGKDNNDGNESHEDGKESPRDVNESHEDGKGSQENEKESLEDGKESHEDANESYETANESYENGMESPEDVKESPEDGKESTEDGKESTEDGKESTEDGKESPEDGKESTEDVKESPDDVKESPEDVKESPEDVKESPEDGKESREDGKESREDGKESPEDGKEIPEDGKESPEDGKESPVDDNESPEDANRSPEDGNKSSDDGKESPEDGKESHECKESKPDPKSHDGEEMVLIEDTSFNIKIHAPGIDAFDLPVSSMELVQEIQQVLYDKEDTCHRTCFTLQLDNTVLDNFAELKTIDGLTDGSVLKVVEELYTVREARIHVRHVRDLLKSVDLWDAYNGVNSMSLSFLNTVTCGDILDKKRSKPDTMDCTPPDYVLPNSKDRPLLPLHPFSKETRVAPCLKVLTNSGWNPPPGNRRMRGDLLYLMIVTLEDKKFHITASTRGFFINQSTDDVYNPKAAPAKYLNHSLIDLLNQVSPAFKKNFAILLKKRAQKHPFERVTTPYQVHTWLSPSQEHHIDSIRAEDAFSAKLGYEEHIPGQTRDWNEELQTTRELPRKSLPERLIRERAIFKIHSDFVSAATRAATAVIDGNIMAINPGESSKMQMFIWNNIFFSLGFDVKDHYKEFGGDAAAHVAPSSDLQGVKAYTGVDAEGLYTLGTVVVDYRGFRVTAQSIIPGILEREQEQSVVYGSIDFGDTVVSNEKYIEFLEKTRTQLKIRPHRVLNDKGEEVLLMSSVECKGIVGNDGRYYVLDLLRTFPPDVNFLPVEGEELCNEVRDLGFPVQHRHKLVCLRQELIEAFVEGRYVQFVKCAAYQFQQMRLNKAVKDSEKNEPKQEDDESSTNSDNSPLATSPLATSPLATSPISTSPLSTSPLATSPLATPPLNKSPTATPSSDENVENAKRLVEEIMGSEDRTFEDSSKDIVRRAAQAVGSVSDTAFDIAFNPDVFQPRVRHANPEGEEFRKDKKLVKEAAEFLLLQQLPLLVKECRDHQVAPIDGDTLSESMHQRGINIRYLGKFTELLSKYPNMAYLQGVATLELINRAAKHLFQLYMHGVDTMRLSAAISHFLNCFLGSFPNPHAQIAPEDLQSRNTKKKNKRKPRFQLPADQDSTEWATETPRTLWKKLVDEVSSYYHYRIEHDSLDALVDEFAVHKVSLLRAFCQRCGIQLLLRDYQLEARAKPPFCEDDIINLYPIVKHIHPKASDAYHFFTSGQTKIQQGFLRDGHELISEALNLLNNVYGPIHPEIAACNKLLARLNYIMGEHTEALAYQQRSVLISERVLGIDHPSTISEYAHLALYCFANGQVSNALRLLYRARYLALICCGELHPEVALIDSNIGLILHAVNEFELSLRFLEKALQLNIKLFGERNLKVAMSYHLVARAQSCRGDFRTALLNEKLAYNIYTDLLGEEHDRTQESAECLNHLTKQAVDLQKKMNDIAKGDKVLNFPPIQIQPPSLANVLDTLNVINGIFFVHLSPSDIDKLRAEMVDECSDTKPSELTGEQMKTTPTAAGSGAGQSADLNHVVMVNGEDTTEVRR